MQRWQQAKLATRDDVHLTRDGYLLLAELFDQALQAAAPIQPPAH